MLAYLNVNQLVVGSTPIIEANTINTLVDSEAYGYIEAKRRFLKANFPTKH